MGVYVCCKHNEHLVVCVCVRVNVLRKSNTQILEIKLPSGQTLLRYMSAVSTYYALVYVYL